MTPTEARLTAAIRDSDTPVTVKELAAVTGLSLAAVRSHTNALGARGLLARRRAGWVLGQRGRIYAATSRGQAVLDAPRVARG